MGDLRRPGDVFDLCEGDRLAGLGDGEDARAAGKRDLAGLLGIVAGILAGEVLGMPGRPQSLGRLVGNLLHRHPRDIGRCRLVTHVEQSQRVPPERLEPRPQRVGGGDRVEVDPSMRGVAERVVGDRDQLLYVHRRLLIDPDQVEVPVVGIAGRAKDRPVRPRLGDVADPLLAGVVPGARPAGGGVAVAHAGRPTGNRSMAAS